MEYQQVKNDKLIEGVSNYNVNFPYFSRVIQSIEHNFQVTLHAMLIIANIRVTNVHCSKILQQCTSRFI